jgi:hypothetical protein
LKGYTSCNKAINPQAKRTQIWQLKYFLEVKENTPIDIAKARHLFNQESFTTLILT